MTRNVVLIVLDSTRKDVFDANAGTLRDRADVNIDECRAASNWSPASHGSLFTGTLPHVNGVHAHAPDWDGVDFEDTFLSAYADHRRIGISSNLFAGRPHRFDRYFDEFVSLSRHSVLSGVTEIDAFRADSNHESLRLYLEYLREASREGTFARSLANGLVFKYHEFADGRPLPRLWDFGARTSLRAARRKMADTDGPKFLFLNTMETHNPFANSIWYRGEGVPLSWSSNQYDTYTYNNLDPEERPRDYARNYKALYEASIRYTADQLIRFIDWCDESLARPTTFVVTSDHGEQLGTEADGGLISHVGALSESLLHVPMAVVNPPRDTDITEGRYFSHLELSALMEALADETLQLRYRDRIPAEVIGSSAPEGTERFEYWDRMIRAAYDDREKFVWDSLGDRRHFHVGEQPCHETELATNVEIPPHALDHFKVSIEEFKGQFGDSQRKDWAADAPTERLRDLGYL